MAENTATKSRNQAFLEQHERQRLDKLCNRTIDLRGKVAGECQAYQFGGKTHYLDDRAYLIAKQLLERFNGRYTFGVYETVLKALKVLSAKDETETEKEVEFILSRSRSEVQLIPFSGQLQRKESRIIFATPVVLYVADVLYHGATIDITSGAISVALKRVSTLEKGDKLLVSFPELSAQHELKLLVKIPYSVLAIEHDDLRTRLVLLRDRECNKEAIQQLDLWCKQHNSPEYLDLDNELFNLACNYYQHLYCRTLTSPQFWLNPNDPHDPIKAFQLVPTSESTLNPFREEGKLGLSRLPFNEIIAEQCDFLLQISSQQAHIARRDDTSQISALLNNHLIQESSHILLLKTQKTNINTLDFEHEISLIAKNTKEYANDLEQRLNSIGIITSVTNISSCCTMLEESLSEGVLSTANPWQGKTITPSYFRHTITREKSRYLIRTNIQILANGTKFQATTADVSTSGLAVNLPGDINLALGSRVTIDFVRWQQQTSSVVKLSNLTYLVRSCRFWDGKTHIGLEREKVSATISVNHFFTSTIKRSKAQLFKDNQDTIISQESEIFGGLLGQHLTTIPFYLGMDNDNKRILQAVVSPHNTHKNTLWVAFQSLVTMISELLNALPDNTTDSIHFGIYCYQDNAGNWQLATDHDFRSISDKSLFINRALANKEYHFFHCRLCPIKFTWLEQEADLNRQLMELRNHSPHKVKQMRSIFLSLFAVGELTDITDIISAHYINTKYV